MKCVVIITLMALASVGFADDAVRYGNNASLDVSGDMACVGYEQYLDFIDWSDIAHPKRLSRLKLKPRDGKPQSVHDVALREKTAYVAVGNAGIAVVDLHEPGKPREINFVKISYAERYGRSIYCFNSLKLQGDFLFVESDYSMNLGHKNYCDLHILNVENALAPELIKFNFWMPPVAPFHEYSILDDGKKIDDLTQFQHGYYIERTDHDLTLWVSHADGRKTEKITLELDKGEQAKIDHRPQTRASGDFCVIALGKRLWAVDLAHERIIGRRDFDFELNLHAFNGKAILIGDYDTDDYSFVDVKDMNEEIKWSCSKGINFALLNSPLLLVSDEADNYEQEFVLRGYNVKNLNSVKENPFSFLSWGRKMDEIERVEDLLFGLGDQNSAGAGTIQLVDCRDAEHPKLRGMVKGLNTLIHFQLVGTRLYVIDSQRKSDDYWYGVPTAVDWSDLDHPAIKSRYSYTD